MIWLQRCIEDNVILDPTSYFLFRPITTPISDSTLSDCVLAFSQFSDLEREHLVRFGKRLGATVQDHFARYPGHGLLATTHLLLKTGSGEKYSCALKWGIPAVSDEWLFACAAAQKIVPVSSFLIQSGEAEQTAAQTASNTTTTASKPCSNSDMGMDTSSKPHSDSDVRMETGNEDAAQVEPSDNHPLSSVVLCFNKKLAAQESHLSKIAVSLGAECRHRLDKTCTHYIYQGKSTEAVRDKEVKLAKEGGCFIVSPHWITACSERGSRVHESDYPHTYNPNMALGGVLQTQSGLPLSQSQAKSNRMPLQPTRSSPIPNPIEKPESDHSSGNDSSEPIKTQHENEDQENENGIPIEVAKQLQQHLEELREAPKEQQRRRRSRRLAKKGSEDAVGQLPPPPLPPPSHASPGKGRGRRGRRVRRKEEHLMDSQVSDSQLLQVTYDDPEGRKEKEKLLARVEREEQLRAKGLSAEEIAAASRSISKADPDVMEVDAPPPPVERKSTTNTTTQQQKRGVASVVKKPTEVVVINDRDLPSSTPLPPPLNVPIVTHSARPTEVQSLYDEKMQTRVKRAPPKFLLSSLDQREKVDYGALIQELGGEYIDQDYFTTKCTHLVVGKASRTEKYLGACAAGKWVLHKSYLEECRQAKRFVEEHRHEWGERVGGGGEVSPLEAAPRRWRLALANKNTGAFQGWKVMLFVERNKLPGLKRLLEAGGAHVVTRITSAVLREVTHAFIAISHFPKELSLEQLAKLGVQCLKPDYIAEYLSKGEVQADAFYISDVRPFMTKPNR